MNIQLPFILTQQNFESLYIYYNTDGSFYVKYNSSGKIISLICLRPTTTKKNLTSLMKNVVINR